MIVIDGLSYSLFEKFKYRLKYLTELAEKGIYSKLESVTPALTPIALASLFTGLLPKNNGVTGPKIFVKGNKISSPVSAFSSKALITEPLWAFLARKGLKAVVTCAPQALPDKWNLKNLILLDPYKSKFKNHSKSIILKEGENVVLEKKWLIKLNGEKFIIKYPYFEDYKIIELEKHQWSNPVEFTGKYKDKEYRSVTILHSRDNDIYLAPPAFLNNEWANNIELQKEIWENISLKHGMILDGDYQALSDGIISFEEYINTVKLSFNFFLNYSKYILEKLEWDFGITYLPIVDNVQHLLYGINDSKALDYIYMAYEMADEFVKEHLNMAETLIIVSDHGIEKVNKRVYVNKILEKINVLKVNGNEIDWKKSKAYYAGGGMIRINLKGREDRGIVDLEEYPRLVRYIVKHLENLYDKETNEKIFKSIIANEKPAGDREADILVGVAEYYSLSTRLNSEVEIEKVKPYITATGDHGYYRKNDLYGIVIFSGKGIQKRRLSNARIIDIFPTVIKLLGFEPPKSDGVSLF
jgi:predicted AlkP superfamily phosphohydrolase/phosphomutase